MMKIIIQLEAKKMFRQWWLIPATIALLLLLFYSFENRSKAVLTNKQLSDSTAVYHLQKKQEYLKELDSATVYQKKYASFSTNPLNPNYYNSMAPQMAVYTFSPMAVLATGQSDLFSEDYIISSPSREPGLKQEDITNPLFRLFGNMDPAFVLAFLLPLFIIAMGYNFISGERESDTLKLLLVHSPSFSKWVWAKLILQVGYTSFIFITATVLMLFIKGAAFINLGLPLVTIVAGLFLYILFWHLLPVLLNLIYEKSSMVSIALTSCWVVFVFILPSIINIVATVIHKVPSRVEYISAYRMAYSEAEKQGRQEMLDRYFFDHPELSKPDTANQRIKDNLYEMQIIALYENVRKGTTPITAKYEVEKWKSNQFAGILQLVSPSALFNSLINEQAGVSEAQYQQFNKAANNYRLQYLDYLKEKVFKDADMKKEEVEKRMEFKYAGYKSKKSIWFITGLLLWIIAIYTYCNRILTLKTILN